MYELLAVDLPRTMQFLQPGWFVLHLAVIPIVFIIGMAVGRKTGFRAPGTANP